MRGTALLVFVAIVTGCVTTVPAGTAQPGVSVAPPTPAPPPTPTAPPKISAQCVEELTPVLEALEELDARLDVGMNQRDYSARVGDVSVAYSRLDAGDLQAIDPQCILAAVELEHAFNSYIGANDRWSNCISDTDCETDSIRGALQNFWKVASDRIDNARAFFP